MVTPNHIHLSQYSISTITLLSGIDARVDIELVFAAIACYPDNASILNARLSASTFKGLYKPKKRRKPRKVFLNQITFDILVGNARRVSVKLFRDGRIQLAGCRTIEEAAIALEMLVRELNRIRVYWSNLIASSRELIVCFVTVCLAYSFRMAFLEVCPSHPRILHFGDNLNQIVNRHPGRRLICLPDLLQVQAWHHCACGCLCDLLHIVFTNDTPEIFILCLWI